MNRNNRPRIFALTKAVVKNMGVPSCLLYALILSVLTGLTVKDLVKNVDDFINNNRVTLTKLITATGKHPYLTNLTFYFIWDDGSRDNDWSKAVVVDYQSPPDNVSWQETDGYKLLKLLNCLVSIDSNVLAQEKLVAYACDYEAIERALRNASFSVWVDRLAQSVQRLVTSDPRATFFPDNLSFGRIALMFATPEHFEASDDNGDGDQPEVVYCFGNASDRGSKITVLMRESIFLYRRSLLTANLQTVQNVEVRVTTAGMVDVNGFEICNRHVISDEDAVSHCRLKQIVRRCNCVPFLFRKLVQDKKAFCTRRLYEACLTDVDWKLIGKRCKSARACVNNNAVYATTAYSDAGQCPGATLGVVIRCHSSKYLIMQEQMLTTGSQLLAQIGGNLGLYLGISLLSVWKVVTVVCFAWRPRIDWTDVAPTTTGDDNRQGFAGQITRFNRPNWIGNFGQSSSGSFYPDRSYDFRSSFVDQRPVSSVAVCSFQPRDPFPV